ncbi:uncharacterized protein LOC118341050 [Morone saxatilis]|uniref:uncharacterized protein LOC118341050 n=1 Tax=Morone saxatilis TaxID=34816 RepID=UPI0015E24B15|nr:uncharacterized protein LOC118341050 [Morone saxatilis]
MMAEFRRIKIFFLLTPVLQITAAVTGQRSDSFTVRVGDDVTLSCENVIKDQKNCDSTTWLFSDLKNAVALFEHGQIHKDAMAKSDRLSVPANCSLVIKKVTVEDVGRYTCRQFISGQQQGPDSLVDLSVITIEKQQYNDTVVLFCAVLTYEGCGHTVKWLYDDNKNDTEILDSTCSSRVTFPTRLNQKSNYYELLKCNVTDDKRGQTLLCDVGPQSSCETTGSILVETEEEQQDWWRFIIVSVGLAALITIAVAVNIWTKTKGNRTQMDEHIVSFKP